MNMATRTDGNAQETMASFGSAELEVRMQPLLTVTDLEALLRVDKRTIQRLCTAGRLPKPFRVGGQNRWQHSTIAAAIEEMEAPMNVG